MKKFLFVIVIMILTPIYLVIQLMMLVFEMIMDFTEPFADCMNALVDDMCKFWKKIFKIKEDQYGKRRVNKID